jgi:hypothetical protein
LTTTGNTGITIWASSDPASIHGASAAQEASIRNRIVASFTTEATRDAAYSGLTSAQKAGILCWVVSREGHCYWDPTSAGWQWVSVRRPLIEASRPSAADSSGAVLVDILLMPSTTLPPGNRRVMVIASSNVVALANGGSYPMAQITGTGIAGSEGNCATFTGFSGASSFVHLTRTVTVSGSVSYLMRGKDSHPTSPGAVRFTDSILQVYDLGPA